MLPSLYPPSICFRFHCVVDVYGIVASVLFSVNLASEYSNERWLRFELFERYAFEKLKFSSSTNNAMDRNHLLVRDKKAG